MDPSVSEKGEIWFLRVCHHVSNALYVLTCPKCDLRIHLLLLLLLLLLCGFAVGYSYIRPVHVGFVVDMVALGQILPRVIIISFLVIFIPQTLHIYPSATDAVWSYNVARSLGSTSIDAAGCLLEVPHVLWKLIFCLVTMCLSRSAFEEPGRAVESSWNVMAHGDARQGKWRSNWRMEWVASTLHTTSEHGVSSITTTDAHTSAASSRLIWLPRRFKRTRPFRRKTKSGFCACALTFQTQSTNYPSTAGRKGAHGRLCCTFFLPGRIIICRP